MARTFDGANDSIHTSIGACGLTGAYTVVAVARRASNTSYHNLCTVHTSGGVSTFGLEIESNGDGNQLQAQVGAGFIASSFTVLAADGWVLLAAGKAAGVTTPRMHKYAYGTDTWTHQDGAGTFGGDPASSAGGTVRFGEWEGGDDFDGDLAAAAIFNRNLTDGEVEQLAHSLLGWHSLTPVGMWLFDQQATSQAVVDLTGGGANQSAIAGTTVATSSVPGLAYGHEPLVPHSVPAAGGTTFTVDVAGSVTPAGALARQVGKPLAGATTPSGALVRQTGNAYAGASTPSGALLRLVGKPLSGSTTPTGTVATIRARLISLAGAIAPSGALRSQTGKALAGSVAPTGAATKRLSRTLADGIGPTGAVLKLLGRLLGGTTAPSGALGVVAGIPATGSMAWADRTGPTAAPVDRTGATANPVDRAGPTMTAGS